MTWKQVHAIIVSKETRCACHESSKPVCGVPGKTGYAFKAYTIPDNRQKIFYRLLEKGRFLYEEHEKRHKLWLERDRQFLSQFTELQLEEFSKFMSSYNGYLEEQIRQLGGREDAD